MAPRARHGAVCRHRAGLARGGSPTGTARSTAGCRPGFPHRGAGGRPAGGVVFGRSALCAAGRAAPRADRGRSVVARRPLARHPPSRAFAARTTASRAPPRRDDRGAGHGSAALPRHHRGRAGTAAPLAKPAPSGADALPRPPRTPAASAGARGVRSPAGRATGWAASASQTARRGHDRDRVCARSHGPQRHQRTARRRRDATRHRRRSRAIHARSVAAVWRTTMAAAHRAPQCPRPL